jgi:hypothetical protein
MSASFRLSARSRPPDLWPDVRKLPAVSRENDLQAFARLEDLAAVNLTRRRT